MLTFSQLISTSQEATGDTSATTLVLIKRWLNQANRIMHSQLSRYWTRRSQTTSIVANQQYYQLPEDLVRVTEVIITSGTTPYWLQEIESESQWRQLNEQTATASIYPQYYFVRGKDEIGIWPTPTAAISNGLEVAYEPFEKDMTQDDYTDGTIAVTNGATAVTGTGTAFAQNMIGRYLRTEDGSDGIWYRISAFGSTTALTLENYYEGIGGSGKTYKIGEMPGIPGDLHDNLVDYVMLRYSLRNKDDGSARDYQALWQDALSRARSTYATKSTSRVIHRKVSPRINRGFYQEPYNIT